MPSTITLPGLADDVVRFGGWRADRPDYFAQYEQGQTVRAGRGWRYTVTLSDDAADDLRDYLISVRDALASMTFEERGVDGSSDLRAVRATLDRWPVNA